MTRIEKKNTTEYSYNISTKNHYLTIDQLRTNPTIRCFNSRMKKTHIYWWQHVQTSFDPKWHGTEIGYCALAVCACFPTDAGCC